MNIIQQRTTKLRAELEEIKGNRQRLDHLKDYYHGKTAIVIATGPSFQDYTDLIKDNVNENTIIICVKQALKAMNYEADFHLLNMGHFEEYEYPDIKPITLMTYYPGRKIHPYGDIHFFLAPMPGVSHDRVNSWTEIDNDRDSLTFNDRNLGAGDNMVIHKGHMMMESVFPLCVHLGVKRIITNGWIGGGTYGIEIKNRQSWSRYPYLETDLKMQIRVSEKLTVFMKKHYDIDIYTISDSKFKIERITSEKYVELCNS